MNEDGFLQSLMHALRMRFRPTPEDMQKFDAEMQAKAMQTQLNPRPVGIHGGKFGEAARNGMDRTTEFLEQIPPSFTEYSKNRALGMDILSDYLHKKFQTGLR